MDKKGISPSHLAAFQRMDVRRTAQTTSAWFAIPVNPAGTICFS